jgi:FkbM family methyltransferase
MSADYFVDVTVNGRWQLRLPDFRALRYTTAGPDGWERARLASMHVNLDPSDVLLDVGTESGDMTALLARWVRSVVAVEPNPVAWPNVRAIFDANGLEPPAAHWVGFVSDVTVRGDDPFGAGWPDCVDGPLVAATGLRHLADDEATTPQITIDDLVNRLDEIPTAVTIDVEGAELRALHGASRFLAKHRPLLWVSVHPAQLRRHFRQVPADVYAHLEALGYRVTHLGDDHETHIFAEPR